MRDDGRWARNVTIALFVATVLQLLVATTATGLSQFEGKAFGARLATYPVLMLLAPLGWGWWHRRTGSSASYPWIGFALIMLPFFIDVTGNSFNLYDSVMWWDDLNHLINWFLLSLGIGVLVARSRIEPPWALGWLVAGLGAMLAIGWEMAEWGAFIKNGTELAGAYEDTLGDELLGALGAALAGTGLWFRLRDPSPQEVGES
jgi:hypothetical protein